MKNNTDTGNTTMIEQFFELAVNRDGGWYRRLSEAQTAFQGVVKMFAKGDNGQQAVVELQVRPACEAAERQGFINGFRFAMELAVELWAPSGREGGDPE